MPQVGDTLGRYTLLERLAVGGMGEVFLAAKAGPVGFGPYVALKVLRDELAVDSQFVDMLVDEANISMFLNHQNVVSVLDLAEDRGSYYIAMEYVQGVTVERLVESLVQRGRKLDIPQALFIAVELCRSLKYAHTRVNHAGEPLNIVHRDVTPANILLSIGGEVKLADFGIARAKGRIHQTQAGVLKGKFGYMAPEMVRYEELDARADLFCTGVVAYLMLTGRHPVAGASVMEAITMYEEKRIPPPSKFNPQLTPALDTIVMRALEPRPEDRWASAAALGDAFYDVMLRNPDWRRAAKDGAQGVAESIRSVAPEIFEEPVPRDRLEQLLERARRAEAAPRKNGGARRGGSEPITSPSEARVSGLVPEDTAPEGRSSGVPAGMSYVDLPTADSLPAIADSDFAPTPAVKSMIDIDTDEQMSVEQVRRAQRGEPDERIDTDEQNPAHEPFESGSNGRAPAVAFPESSTDRNRLREDLTSEPSLPGRDRGGAGRAAAAVNEAALASLGQDRTVAGYRYEESEIDHPLREGSTDDDGETVVGYSAESVSEPSPPGAETLAMEAMSRTARVDDGKTVSGMPMPDWGKLDARVLEPSVSDPLLSSGEDEDAATVIPSGPGGSGAYSSDEVSGVIDASEWARDDDDLGDATLLDGIDVNQVRAAVASAREDSFADRTDGAGGGAFLVRDESRVETMESPSDPTLDYEQIVMDSMQTGARVAQDPAARPVREPAPLKGPIRIVMDDDGEPALARTAAQAAVSPELARSAAEVLQSVASDARPHRAPVREAKRATPTPPGGAASVSNHGELGVGQNTGRWIAGELTASSLDWSDDAAARRAVAARNQQGARGSHADVNPSFPGPSLPAYPPPQASASQPGWNQGSQAPYHPAASSVHSVRPASVWTDWRVIGLLVMAIAVFGALFYSWMFTPLFWPKLKIDSVPQGATVIIDGKEMLSVTPLEVRVEPARQHLVEFKLSGHKRAMSPVADSITRARTYTLRAELARVAPRVHLPGVATVKVNGKKAGSGEMVELTNLPASGPVRLEVTGKGFEPYAVEFGDVSQIPDSLDVALQKTEP